MAADVDGVYPHTGRGGWTWYTGSAGWMYQLILDSFLGLKREGNKIRFEPCVPAEWKSFKVKYRFNETEYEIVLNQTTDENIDTVVTIDGVQQPDESILLQDDKVTHSVVIEWSSAKRKAVSVTINEPGLKK